MSAAPPEPAPDEDAPGRAPHLLSIALEDYFDARPFHQLISERHRRRLESRVQAQTDRVLSLLDRLGAKATFFSLGRLSETHGDTLRRVVAAGHEVGSRDWEPSPLLPAITEDDTAARERLEHGARRSRLALTDASGSDVCGFRVARGRFGVRGLDSLEAVAAAGFAYDSSFYPTPRDGRTRPLARFPFVYESAAGPLVEMPVSTWGPRRLTVPLGGGTVFRQMPGRPVEWMLRDYASRYTSPLNLYFHVWEFDPQLPRLGVGSRLTRIRRYRNLAGVEPLLTRLAQRHRFVSIRDYLCGDAAPAAERAAFQRATDRLGEHPCEQASSPPASRAPVALVPDAPLEQRDKITEWLPLAGRRPREEAKQPCSCRAMEPTKRGRRPARQGVQLFWPGALMAPPAAEAPPALTLVVPCYAEAAVLGYTAEALTELEVALAPRPLRVIFVDDASPDNTAAELERRFGGRPGWSVLRHGQNRGVAAAILTGLRAARTDLVASMDCDCTYDPMLFAEMIPRFEAARQADPSVAVLTASPYHPDGAVLHVPAWRLGLSRGLSTAYRRLLDARLYTFTACVRVYHRPAVAELSLRHGGFLGVAELVVELDRRGFRILEQPATLESRLLGTSKMKTIGTIRAHLGLLARVATLRLRGRYRLDSVSTAPAATAVGA